jgi:hypothetical protein
VELEEFLELWLIRARNDGVIGAMCRKRGEKGEVCEFLSKMVVTNFSPHRWYKMICWTIFCFSELILADTFELYCF